MYADGTSSEVDLSGLTTLDLDTGYITVTDSGTVLDGKLTSLNGVHLDLDGTGTLATDQWTTFTNGVVTITGGNDTLKLTDFDGSNAYVDTGDTLTLQNLASYSNPNGYDDTYFEATCANAVLSLPALTSLGYLQSYLHFQATQGGQVLASALTTLAGPAKSYYVQVYADGTSSEVDLSDLTSLIVSTGYLTVTDGGTVLDPNLTAFANVTITPIHGYVHCAREPDILVPERHDDDPHRNGPRSRAI